MKNKSDKEKNNKKILLITSVSLSAVLAVSMPVYSWFSKQQGLVTMTKVQAPAELNIGAGNEESCAYIDMSGISVTDPEVTSKAFVFCVYSKAITGGQYKIQLAHTTNIPFTYSIYKASESDTEPVGGEIFVSYEDHISEGTTYYYTKGDCVEGSYLNQNGTDIIANNTKHEITYGTYTNVQENAEPLYWQNNTKIDIVPNGSGFTDYYILEVSWDGTSVKNDKETDMVYITAGMG